MEVHSHDAGLADDLTEGVLHEVQVEGKPVILTRLDGEIHAVAGTCPHAGAPLSGHATDWDDLVIHGDTEKPCFIAYYVKQDRVVAAVGMDRDQDMAALIVLFTRSRDWTADMLGHEPKALLGP